MGKAGGRTGVMPELLKYGGAELQDRLLQLMQDMWGQGSVVGDWRDAVVVPIPKKGDLRLCDNWRGISLLDVAGKVLAQIIQERLQIISERVLPESQCGFRKGRGCIDMVFVGRQMVEKCREHNDSLFVLFVDLQKAYDSIPRMALWTVLERYGVPPTMLSVIRSFHDNMLAEVRIGDVITDSFEVKNGLRQGCTLAPSMFNLFFGAVVACWRVRCPDAGVLVKYKHGRKLVGDHTVKSRLSEVRVVETQFADDVAIYCHTREAFESATCEFVRTASDWGLTVSTHKTKALVMGGNLTTADSLPLQVGEDLIEVLNDFTYLGSNISSDGEVGKDVSIRIAKAARAFGCLQKSIFQNSRLSIDTKRKVYKATVLAVLLYGAEAWTIKARELKRLSSFHNRCVRSMMGVSKYQQWKGHISSRYLASAAGMEEQMSEILMKHRLRWLGHLARMDPCRLPKQLLFGELVRRRPCHGVKRRWRDVVAADVKIIDVGDDWYYIAQDRKAWRAMCGDGLSALVDRQRFDIRPTNVPTCSSTGATTYPCSCGRLFHRQGDRTRHIRFCSAITRDS